jgi:negative regulator of flagellin synthesis FlgM
MSYTTGLTPNSLPLTGDASPSDSVRSTTRAQSSGQTSAGQIAAGEIATDSAKVSLAGAMLSQATTGSDVRFDKVAALRQSIEAGTYNIPAASVAGKVFDTLLK